MLRSREGRLEVIASATNRGFTAATNQAFERSTAPYVLMLHSATVVSPGAVSGCVQRLEEHADAAVVGCRVLNPDGTHQSSVFRFPDLRGITLTALYLPQAAPHHPVLNWPRYGSGLWTEPHDVDVVMGGFLLVRRDALDEGPLLDEGFWMYGEETDLCRRLAEQGHRVLFDPDRTIVHAHGGSGTSISAWSETAKRRGMLRFIWKWRSMPVAWLANAIMLLGLVPRMIGWGLADTVDRLRGRPDSGRRNRLGVASFHLEALTRPSAMGEPWGPPSVSGERGEGG
jgi:GT2 family glycosyltransferase